MEAAEVPRSERDRCRARLVGAVDRLSGDDLERVMVQVEAWGDAEERAGVPRDVAAAGLMGCFWMKSCRVLMAAQSAQFDSERT